MNIDEEILKKYQTHPRILEIRFSILFDLLKREYGYVATRDLISGICHSLDFNSEIIIKIVNNLDKINKIKKTNNLRWKQLVIFMGRCYGESLRCIGKNYINCSSTNLYGRSEFTAFADKNWLKELDNEVVLCGGLLYKSELKLFLETIDIMAIVFRRWRGGD